MSISAPRVLIVGGGIGGLAATHALRTVGLRPRVFERATDPVSLQVGFGLNMWPNATRILDRFGVLDALLPRTAPIETEEFVSWRGQLLSSWAVGDISRRLGFPSFNVLRGELVRVLAEPLTDLLELGREFTAFEETGDGVTVSFSDGSTEEGDVLIGADGLMSKVRGQVLDAAPPQHAGFSVWRGCIEVSAKRAPRDLLRLIWGDRAKFLFFPVGDGRVTWMAALRTSPGESDQTAPKQRLLDRFRSWPEPVVALMEATTEEEIRWQDIFYRPPVDRWGAGAVTLLGDAAHAMSPDLGQGACMAIEDAATLASCLQGATDAKEGLRAYEGRRIPRAADVLRRTERVKSLSLPGGPLRARARDAIMPRLMNRARDNHFKDVLSYEV